MENNKYSIPDILAQQGFKCKKEYTSCKYTAQGALQCSAKPETTVEKFNTIPGMSLGGIPSLPQLPFNFKGTK